MHPAYAGQIISTHHFLQKIRVDGRAAESTSYLGLQTTGEFITCRTVKKII
jgi:hypothetical protein